MTYAYKAIIHSLLCSDDNWICNYNFQTHYEGNVSKLADESNISFLFISLMRYTFLKVAKAFLLYWNFLKKHLLLLFVVAEKEILWVTMGRSQILQNFPQAIKYFRVCFCKHIQKYRFAEAKQVFSNLLGRKVYWASICVCIYEILVKVILLGIGIECLTADLELKLLV